MATVGRGHRARTGRCARRSRVARVARVARGAREVCPEGGAPFASKKVELVKKNDET